MCSSLSGGHVVTLLLPFQMNFSCRRFQNEAPEAPKRNPRGHKNTRKITSQVETAKISKMTIVP